MKTLDGREIYIFSSDDEKPHSPGADESWQESVVLYWYDMAQQVGGWFRLGHEPNHEGGMANFVIGAFAPGTVYRRTEKLPLRPEDQFENGFGCGDDSLRYEFDGEKIHWTLQEKDIDLQLVCDLTVPAIDAHKGEGDYQAGDILTAHVDAPCNVSGHFTFKGQTYEVNAIGLRDHAWGNRDLSALLSYRWLIGSFGERDSFVAMTFLSTANQPARFGWVIRGDNVILAEDVDVKAIIGEDGATIFGGNLSMKLTNGEVYQVKFDPILPSFGIQWDFMHPTFYHDCLCKVTWGNQEGFGIFEGTNNIRGGVLKPQTFVDSIGPDGWYEGIYPLTK